MRQGGAQAAIAALRGAAVAVGSRICTDMTVWAGLCCASHPWLAPPQLHPKKGVTSAYRAIESCGHFVSVSVC
jgi:hypothetical protein